MNVLRRLPEFLVHVQWRPRLFLVLVPALFALFLARAAAEADEISTLTVGYLERAVPPPPVLSNLEVTPEDEGLAGAEVGLADNNTTGKFLKQHYALETLVVGEDEDLLSAARDLLGRTKLLVLNMPADDLLAVADLPEAQDALLINVSASDIALRDGACRSNVLHAIPSRAMLADALSQFAVRKKWTEWVLLEGPHEGDQAYASALEDSAEKFGVDVRAKKAWTFDADMRRSAASELPLFVQGFPGHDLLVVSDERGDFGRYVLYNGWVPRPVAGSEGLRPDGWSPSVEQHGAAQLQGRFTEHAGRSMGPVDYAAWAALRTIGEAAMRTKSNEPRVLRDFILSDKFQLAGFKGRKLSYRAWNGQLRQPIPLSHPRAVVALAPLEGFLHQHNEMDTLGLDRGDSACSAFGGQ